MSADAATYDAGESLDRRWLALAVIVLSQFMVVLDTAIVNVALPSIKTDLHFSQENLQWVISAYAIMFGGALLLGGRLADIFGRRRVFVAGVALFSISSLLCGLLDSTGVAGHPESWFRRQGERELAASWGIADPSSGAFDYASYFQAAVAAGSSDIHIEPHEHLVKVRFRQDGLLCDQMTYPRNHLSAVVSRIKVMSRLNIAERRRPQDGKFVFKDEDDGDYNFSMAILDIDLA